MPFQDFISKLLAVDMRKRMTAAQAKTHPWLTASGESLAVRDLGDNLQVFKVFNAKTKLRAAMKTVRGHDHLCRRHVLVVYVFFCS